MDRNRVLNKAVEECLKEVYSLAQPHIDWEEFVKENKNYSNRYKAWKRYYELSKKESLTKEELKEFSVYPNAWKNKYITECIGPRPFEYYYLPKNITDDIVDSYIHAYKIDNHKELLDIIEILKIYCKEPIVNKYIEEEREYEYSDNLEKEINKLLCKQFNSPELSGISAKITNKFFEFLDMAGNFYKWNGEMNNFITEVYLGVAPNTNKQDVIDNWKNYRKQDIIIDDSKYDEYDEE